MIEHDDMLDNVAAYALGVLPARESAVVAEHLQTCAECREEYRLLRPAVTAVASCAQAGAGAVSPLLKARVMRQVRGNPKRTRAIAWRTVLALAACVLFVLFVQARIRIAQQSQTISDLATAQRYPFAQGAVLAHGQRLYIAMRGLPAPPRGKVYQAWTLARGAKTIAPSVTFLPGRDGVAVVALPVSAATVAAVAVSVEPSGGSLQPTTKPIALVKLGS